VRLPVGMRRLAPAAVCALRTCRVMGLWLGAAAPWVVRLRDLARGRRWVTDSRLRLAGSGCRCSRYVPGVAVHGAGAAGHDCGHGWRAVTLDHQVKACRAGGKRGHGGGER